MIHFIVHARTDHVGVAVQDLKAGEKLEGWCMEDDSNVSATANADIPLGHKIALLARKKGEPVLKYGVSIGITARQIEVGDHVHTHNLKTERW